MREMKQFNNRQVQDLAWVIASPPLASGNYNGVHWWDEKECKEEFNDCLPALISLDKNPEPLLSHLSQLKSKRLGLRFESYISYWLKISPNYRQLKQNIQIIEEGHTYGELDFIIENMQSKKIIHLEVAVKFYLGRLFNKEPSDDPYQWFGTNTQDQLGKKIDHLKQHQTQLTVKYPEHIQNNFSIKTDEKQCLLKGRLFYPLGSDISPQGVSENHLRGIWTQSTEQFSNDLFIPIDKEYWLAELGKNELDNLRSQQGLDQVDRAQCYVQAGEEPASRNRQSREKTEKGRLFQLPKDFWDGV